VTENLLRTFVSVTVPHQVLTLQEMLKTTISYSEKNLKWSKPGQIHLTLKFIGYTPPDAVDKINKILEDVAKRHSWMEFTVSGTGCFPTQERPRVLWVGLDGADKILLNFVNDINQSLENLGFPKEEKEFIPHITFGRITYPPPKTPNVVSFLNTKYDPIPMSITRIRLISSELFPNGPIYSILGTHFLASKEGKK
tara:strand:- start:52856 stop:53443 length:588 start_codon:yes stop_codon:yes gene_type:complete